MHGKQPTWSKHCYRLNITQYSVTQIWLYHFHKPSSVSRLSHAILSLWSQLSDLCIPATNSFYWLNFRKLNWIKRASYAKPNCSSSNLSKTPGSAGWYKTNSFYQCKGVWELGQYAHSHISSYIIDIKPAIADTLKRSHWYRTLYISLVSVISFRSLYLSGLTGLVLVFNSAASWPYFFLSVHRDHINVGHHLKAFTILSSTQ